MTWSPPPGSPASWMDLTLLLLGGDVGAQQGVDLLRLQLEALGLGT